MSWLPTHVKEPESSGENYLRIETGQTVPVRIIGTWDKGFIEGWEVWEELDGKPTPRRYREKQAIPEGEYTDKPRYFWFGIILHDGQVKVWQINQASIREKIKAYSRNDKYGDPRGYDIVVSRQGSGMDTKYTVIANPPEKLDAESKAIAIEALETVDVEALYAGEDPFDAGSIENQVGGGDEPF